MSPLAAGSVIDDRFEIEAPLGQGGMGYVLAARHRDLDERVAIKLLLPDKADAAARQRMLREAQNAVKLKSEHSVRILDVVNTGPYAPYIVMELLRGESLAERLSRDEPLAIEDVVEIVVQACEAVGEAHHLQIVHRDLKPSNLFLVDKPGHRWFVKVLDFGVSKRFEADAGHELTHSRALLGSPVYAPPEQLRASHLVDKRADIWAVGVILYQALTRKLPFRGATLAEVCTRILQEPPPSPRALRPEIQSALESVVLRCLEKEPARRFDSIEELVVSLRELAPAAAARSLIYLDALRASSDSEAPREPARRTDAEGALTFSPATLVWQGATRGTRRGASIALAAAVVAALAGLGIWLAHGGPSRRATLAAGSVAPAPRVTPPSGSVASQAPPVAPRASAQPPEPVPSADPAAEAKASPSRRSARRAPAAKRAARPTVAAETHPWVDSR